MDQKQDGGIKQKEPSEENKGHKKTEGQEQRLDLSLPQVAGSALAAIAAAVLASRLGVYGTIIGAGVVSVVATCGGPVFQHFFRRTGEQIREVTVQARPKGRQVPVPRGAATPPRSEDVRTRLMEQLPRRGDAEATRMPRHVAPNGTAAEAEFSRATTHGKPARGRRRSVIAAASVFGVAMIGITGYELASGSDLSGGEGTTLTSVVHGGGEKSAPPSTPSWTPSHSEDRNQESGQGQGLSQSQDRSQTPNTGTGSGRSAAPGSGQGDSGTSADPTPDSSKSGGDAPTPTPTPTPTPSGSTCTTPTPQPGTGA
ncbi:hypothetical protein ACFWDI_13865 [Streptomyces sp. NPDC060064]|uniref:hypothetical protein n=1 Tax=Streptomyces sp. NPDC060064 TaxID=3347049 RepID=UPI0036A26C37